MSERGSFVTEYIYCPKCADAVERVLQGEHKYLCTTRLPGWMRTGVLRRRVALPIVAGKIGGLYSGEELVSFEQEYMPVLSGAICHPVRVAVISDTGGARLFTVAPRELRHNG